ncbi:hypothetical protein BM221_005605 [Beauveria bassiana]|uniref:Cell wall galactomannoprotein n=1 Tax=Beauveria bassiana TaxID=176275 RepID=A0A2N6NP29_BEABA|nr:hypothetical protein BM221_005605 [Beauveria bassiana]
MRFAQTTTFLLAFAAGAHAKISADALVASINNVTQLSAQTNDIATNIRFTNAFRLGSQVLNNFRKIVHIVKDDIAAVSGSDSSASEARPEFLNVTNVQECTSGIQKMNKTSAQVNGVEKRQAVPPYTETNQQLICDALATVNKFVQVHIALLSTVIGKSGLLSYTPLTAPIGAVLRTLEGVVDTLAFGIIALIPFCADDTQQRIDSLDQKFQEAKAAYNPFD